MTASRTDRAALIAILVDCGYKHHEIGTLLGLSRGGVRNLINDPTGEKQRARRERYRGTCEDCGDPTDGSNGPAAASRRCARCAAIQQHDERRWTPETVLAAVAALNDLCVETLGRPIRASDWLSRHDSQTIKYSEAKLAEVDRLWTAIVERELSPLVHLSVVQREVGGLDEAKRILGIDDAAVRPGGTPTHYCKQVRS